MELRDTSWLLYRLLAIMGNNKCSDLGKMYISVLGGNKQLLNAQISVS